MRFAVVVHKDESSGYGVAVPDLPGCFPAEDSIEEAIRVGLSIEVVETAKKGFRTPPGESPNSPQRVWLASREVGPEPPDVAPYGKGGRSQCRCGDKEIPEPRPPRFRSVSRLRVRTVARASSTLDQFRQRRGLPQKPHVERELAAVVFLVGDAVLQPCEAGPELATAVPHFQPHSSICGFGTPGGEGGRNNSTSGRRSNRLS